MTATACSCQCTCMPRAYDRDYSSTTVVLAYVAKAIDRDVDFEIQESGFEIQESGC